MGNTNKKKTFLVILFVVLLTSVPFLNKAYHIDDTVVLHVTQVILEHPLDPFYGDIDWFGYVGPLWETTTNPPFLSYYLAPFASIFDFSEIALHSAMILFLLLMAWGMVRLSERFTQSTYWPMLFVMTSCGVIVSGNLMRDVPAAGLATAALALYVLGTDRNKWFYLFLGSVLAGLAVLTKYSAIIILPLFIIYPFLHRKYRYMFWIWPMVLIFGLWCLHNHLYYGTVHVYYLLFERTEQSGIPNLDKFFGVFIIVGSLLYLMPALLYHYIKRKQTWVFGLAFVGIALLRWHYKIAYHHDLHFFFTTFGVMGAAIIVVYLIKGLQNLCIYVGQNIVRLILQIIALAIIIAGIWGYCIYLYEGPFHFEHYLLMVVAAVLIILCFLKEITTLGWAILSRIENWLPQLIHIALLITTLWGMHIFYKGRPTIEFYFWAVTGFSLLLFCLYEGLRHGIVYVKTFKDKEAADSLFLFAWLCAPVIFSSIFVPFQAVRHLILALPPLTLLAMRYLEREPLLQLNVRKKWLGSLLVIQTVMAFLIQIADMEYASTYRDFARYAKANWTSEDYDTWYVGAWGFKFYTDEAGFKQVSRNREFPKEGDILLWPKHLLIGYAFHDHGDFVNALDEPVDQVVYEGLIPIRTMNSMSGHRIKRYAGFYAYVSCFGRIVIPYRLCEDYVHEVGNVFKVNAEAAAAEVSNSNE